MAGIRDAIAADIGPSPTKVIRIPQGFRQRRANFSRTCARNTSGAYGFNEHNIVAGKDDAKFTVGNQWDPVVEQRRKDANKPVLTFNRLIAFVAQIVGNRLMNETEIRCHPDKAGHQGNRGNPRGHYPQHFQEFGNADFARDEAHKYQVVGGQGFLRARRCATRPTTFSSKKSSCSAVTDPYSAVFDPLGIEPSGADCQWGFVGDDIPQQEFKRRYPWAADVSFMDERVEPKRFLAARGHRADRQLLAHGHGRDQNGLRSIRTARFTTLPKWRNSSISTSSKRARTAALYPRGAQALRPALHLLGQRNSRRPLRLSRFVDSRFTACRDGN
jgi:hypothetical protein